MNSNDSVSREALIRMVAMVRPALASQDYIPALKHILMASGFASAYNDIAAIRVRLPSRDLSLGLCLPGEMFAKTLASFNADKVMLQPGADGSLLVVSGRSKIKMPTLPPTAFPLSLPEAGKAPSLALTPSMLQAIQMCLLSVGNDPTHPATLGVTLDVEDGRAIFYSTDNHTLSRCETRTDIRLPGDAPVILPTFFCEQLVALAKGFPNTEIDLELHPGALVAHFFDGNDVIQASVFQKTLVDLEPLDFPKIVRKHLDTSLDGLAQHLCDIPPSFDSAFNRALLILGSEVDKATKLTLTETNLKLLSTSQAGEATDTVTIDGEFDGIEPFFVDPSLVVRACKSCSKIAFTRRVLVMASQDAGFIHLIAHCSAS